MYPSKFKYLPNCKVNAEQKCSKCNSMPAVSIESIYADCYSDALGPFCQVHMKEFFDAVFKEFDNNKNIIPPCFAKWVCYFPGKLGITWKRFSQFGVGTEEEAKAEASKWGNVVAIPLQLAEKFEEHVERMILAEQKLEELKCGKVHS